MHQMNHKVVDLENTMAAEELEPEPLDAEEMTKRGYTKKNGLLYDADESMVRMTKKRSHEQDNGRLCPNGCY